MQNNYVVKHIITEHLESPLHVDYKCKYLKKEFAGKKFCSDKCEYYKVSSVYHENNITIVMCETGEIRYRKTMYQILKSGKI